MGVSVAASRQWLAWSQKLPLAIDVRRLRPGRPPVVVSPKLWEEFKKRFPTRTAVEFRIFWEAESRKSEEQAREKAKKDKKWRREKEVKPLSLAATYRLMRRSKIETEGMENKRVRASSLAAKKGWANRRRSAAPKKIAPPPDSDRDFSCLFNESPLSVTFKGESMPARESNSGLSF